MNLMRMPLLGGLLRSPILQRTLQLVLLAGYLALVVLGLGQDGIPGVPDLHPRMYTHATTLLFWVVWLMGLVFLAPLAARAWCGVCPLGYLTDVMGRRGLALRWPRWVRSGWGTLALFGLGVLAVVRFEAHRSPHLTALLIGAVGVVAVCSALLWRRSAFCKGLCPVGSVLHLYSRYAPLRVLPVSAEGCHDCGHAGCVIRRRQWRRWDVGRWVVQRQVSRGGCPVALYPPDMDTGACLLCLRCVRNCPEGNLGLFLRSTGERRPLDPTRVGTLVVVLGLVAYALTRTWPVLQRWLVAGGDPSGDIAGVWLVLGFPALLVCAPGVISAGLYRLRGQEVPRPGARVKPEPPATRTALAREKLGRWVLPLIGPLLGAHAALALVKLNAKGGYLPYLFYDPQGASTYLAVHVARVLPQPDLLVHLPVLRWVAVVTFAVGLAAGVHQALKSWKGDPAMSMVLYAASFVAVSGLLGGALVHWLF